MQRGTITHVLQVDVIIIEFEVYLDITYPLTLALVHTRITGLDNTVKAGFATGFRTTLLRPCGSYN